METKNTKFFQVVSALALGFALVCVTIAAGPHTDPPARLVLCFLALLAVIGALLPWVDFGKPEGKPDAQDTDETGGTFSGHDFVKIFTDPDGFYQDRLDEIPLDVLEPAIRHLQTILSEKDTQFLSGLIDQQGFGKWYAPYHFYWGMAIRNSLREAGLLDDRLPRGNWDDYTCPVIEMAVGKRQTTAWKKAHGQA